ncbi:MAG: glutamate mutase L [Chloroflexota bacterium]
MNNLSIEGHTCLAVEIGSVNTRAAFFDTIDGKYRYISTGFSSSTANFPISNAMTGVFFAIENLQELIGKQLLDKDRRLIIPSRSDGSGVDHLVTLISNGKPIKILTAGLLPDVSMESLINLSQTTNSVLVDSIDLKDDRLPDEQVDSIVQNIPDLILLAGGSEGGAANTIQNILDILGLGIYLLPVTKHPDILFSGNSEFAKIVQHSLKNIANQVYVCPNIRPTMEIEDIKPAQVKLAEVVANIKLRQMPELEIMAKLSTLSPMPSSFSHGRMIRFLSSYFGSRRGVLGVDIGGSGISTAFSISGDLQLNACPELGLGEPSGSLLEFTTVEEISRWLCLPVSGSTVRNYLAQKSLYPGVIPSTREELAVEYAVIRQNLNLSVQWMNKRFAQNFHGEQVLLPSFEQIVVSGSAITNAENDAQKLLLILDGLQPNGISQIYIDQYNLLAMLGAIAEIDSLIPIQIIDSGVLYPLALVIAPVQFDDKPGQGISINISGAGETSISRQVMMDELVLIKIPESQKVTIKITSINGLDFGIDSGKEAEFEIAGSKMGVVIDLRKRPLQLPENAEDRINQLQKWSACLGVKI